MIRTLACASAVFLGGCALGWFLTGQHYEGEIARADRVLLQARGYQDAKRCAEIELDRVHGLMAALESDIRFHACITDAVRMTEITEEVR